MNEKSFIFKKGEAFFIPNIKALALFPQFMHLSHNLSIHIDWIMPYVS